MVHSIEDGKFKELWLSERAQKCIAEQDVQVQAGTNVNVFSGSHDTLGTMILRYADQNQMLDMVDNMEHDIRVLVEK